jgi:hypothetical protein
MLRLDALELMQRFRKPGGDEFADFCNRIIFASCWAGAVPASAVSTTSRTDARDGGVDTCVAAAVPGDRSGYLDVPTIWQFKATDASSVSETDMEAEANKPHAKRRIEEGHGYRLCVCDHLTDEKREILLVALARAVRKINESAPPPKILSLDSIVEFANSFPALVLEYRPGAEGKFCLFEPWSQSVTSVTPIFVPSTGFEAIQANILFHVDLGNEVLSPVLTAYGAAGAGKTRVVFESLRDVPAARSLVLYTSSEDDAVELANMLVNHQDAHAMVVADECSISARERISRILMGFRHRIRCVCIDNDPIRESTPAPELVVPKLTSRELENVLRANFEQIPPERVRAYADYCDGSVRLAADMCAHYDAEIAQSRTMGPALGRISEYFGVRLRDVSDREAIEAVALFRRVKYKGEPPTELDLVCALTGIHDKAKLERALSRIKDTPGWVEKGALYYRVTPGIIAMAAFNSAWRRWAEGNEDDFLGRVPAAIQESFLQRVSESASPEVRDIVQRFFRKFADDFAPRDLGDIRMVNRFVSLIETDSGSYIPTLRRVVEAATSDDLTPGAERTRGSWGPRRQLVWTMENFVAFPEHFADCEAVLFRLAQHECEQGLGNNATNVWQHLFRIQMPGTAAPLAARVELLRSRLRDATIASAGLISGALGEVLDTMGTRLMGPPVVGGRVPPADWHPHNQEEVKESIWAGLVLLDDSTQHPLGAVAGAAKGFLLGRLEALTRLGWLGDLRSFVSQSRLDESDRASLATRLKHILAWGKDTNNKAFGPEYTTALKEWIASLEPVTFHARLVGAVGGSMMEYYGREKEWEHDLDQLALELIGETALFDSEIAWLTSNEAKSSFQLGNRLGTLDRSAALIDKIFGSSVSAQIDLARGYIAGLLYGANVDPQIVSSRLDVIEAQNPLLSFQVALAGGARVKVFDRAIRLIGLGQLPAHALRNFVFWVGDVRVTNEQVIEALSLLTPLAAGDSLYADVIVEFLGARMHVGQFDALLETDADPIWKAISAAAARPGRDAVWLGKVLEGAAPTDWPRAIHIASLLLVGDNFECKDEAGKLLSTWARLRPDEVMSSVGALMLNEQTGWRFFASKFNIFHAIPEDVVIQWLGLAGVDGARKIARHLPQPYLDENGDPQVPPLTLHVLSQFGDDRVVLGEFCAGSRSYRFYMGDIAGQLEDEAKSVRPFLNHDLKPIREWARYQHDSGIEQAKSHREHADEMTP